MYMKELSNPSSYAWFCNKNSPLRDGSGFEWYSFVNIFPFDIRKVLMRIFCVTFLRRQCSLVKGGCAGWHDCWIPPFLPYSLLVISHFELWSLWHLSALVVSAVSSRSSLSVCTAPSTVKLWMWPRLQVLYQVIRSSWKVSQLATELCVLHKNMCKTVSLLWGGIKIWDCPPSPLGQR